MWANHFPVIFLFAHALPNTFFDARKSCLDIPRTLRALFTQHYESFHNTALIVSSCATANEFISWLVSNFMPSCVLSVSCRMLSEIRWMGGDTDCHFHHITVYEMSNYFVMFSLTSDTQRLTLRSRSNGEAVRRGRSVAGQYQFLTYLLGCWLGSRPSGAALCISVSLKF